MASAASVCVERDQDEILAPAFLSFCRGHARLLQRIEADRVPRGGSVAQDILILDQPVAVRGDHVEPVGFSQDRDQSERFLAKGRRTLKVVQDHPLKEIAQADLMKSRYGFQDLQDAFLDANPGLDSLDALPRVIRNRQHRIQISSEAVVKYGRAEHKRRSPGFALTKT
jgi:hypothetical protein